MHEWFAVGSLEAGCEEKALENISLLSNAPAYLCHTATRACCAGVEVTPYKSLAGILSERFGGTADDIGGPLTESLVMAAMSTRERMEHLEKQLLQKHR
jgi:hypothetical protein